MRARCSLRSALLVAFSIAALAPRPARGETAAAPRICLAPVPEALKKEVRDPALTASDVAWSVSFDGGERIPISRSEARWARPLVDRARHSAAIFANGKQIESFFLGHTAGEGALCLFQSPLYGVWNLARASGHGSHCRCSSEAPPAEGGAD